MAWASIAARRPPHRSAWVRSACSFFSFFLFFFFFFILLVLIQLYFKNWILFCVLCLDYVRNGVRSACSFFFFHVCLFWFNFILRIRFCFVFCVWIMWETERMREKKKSRGVRKNWYNNSWDNFLSKKIDLKVLQCSLDLENYCSNIKNFLENLCIWRSCWSVKSNIWLSKNGFTVVVGDALSASLLSPNIDKKCFFSP